MEGNPQTETSVELALRCYPALADARARWGPQKRRWPPDSVLVFDTETTTDARQQLTFGSYRGYRLRPDTENRPIYDLGEEVLFYADNAPAQAIERLRAYARTHRSAVPGRRRIDVIAQSEFVKTLLHAAVKARALIAAFNFPFDVSRIAFSASDTRVKGNDESRRNGFSFVLSTYVDKRTGQVRERRFRPRITIKTIDSKRSLKGFARPFKPDAPEMTPDDSLTGKAEENFYVRPYFLELRTLAFSLTDRALTLDLACEAFRVKRKRDPGVHPGWDFDDTYIDYNRHDTDITGQLLFAMLDEYARHPIGVAPIDVYSPASIGKRYLRSMGLTPPLRRWPDFPKDKLGFAMSTFYGGRTSAHIRRFLVPVRYCDFLSMYPTVNTLLRTWDLLIAADYRVVDATEQARGLIAGLTLEQLFDPSTWPELGFFARIVPNADVLPVRAKWEGGDARQIGINPLTASDAIWYAGPDLAAAVLLSGKAPQVEEAFAIEPVLGDDGQSVPLDGLKPIKLLDSIAIDPRRENFFRKVIEERKRSTASKRLGNAEKKLRDKGLKVIANASSYGIFAQMDSVDLAKDESREVEVFGALGSFRTKTKQPERPGEYFFPPIAALITAGARCMLAMLERCVTDAGGTYAMEDTDSMAIVATSSGGLVPCPGGPHQWKGKARSTYRGRNARAAREAIRALSFAEVDAIAERFEALNPYDRSVVTDRILEVEPVNFDERGSRQVWCYAISSKRYALFTLDEQGEPHVAFAKDEPQCSEHGLGHLLNPIDIEREDRRWIVEAWETIAREHLRLPVEDPPWLDRPALTRLTVSTPYLWQPFEPTEEHLPYAERVKPFNFLLAAHVAPLGYPPHVDKTRFLPIAPYDRDPKHWLKLPWRDVHSRKEYRITTDPDARLYHPDRVLVQTYRDALALFRLHPEAKSLRPDGLPCDELHKDCAGLLQRRPALVPPGAIDHIGKEMDALDDVLAGIAHNEDDIVTRYRDPRNVPFDRLRVLLRCISLRELVARTGLSGRTIERARRGTATPHAVNQERLRRAVLHIADEGGVFSFEAIESLNPAAIAAEIRAVAADRSAGGAQPVTIEEARAQLAQAYAARIREALALIGY
jgi:hypothetical protein